MRDVWDIAVDEVRKEWIAAGRSLGDMSDDVQPHETGDDDIAYFDAVEKRVAELKAAAAG
ncbi:MAG: hypothetical protein WKF96_21765 [Solirubrobacteraceae bacterium]